MRQDQIDDQVFELYDEYCHGSMDRRQFLERASLLTVAGVSAVAMAEALLPNYADAQEIQFTDERIKANWVEYPSPGGTSGEMRGYLVAPEGEGPFPAVLVMHEKPRPESLCQGRCATIRGRRFSRAGARRVVADWRLSRQRR